MINMKASWTYKYRQGEKFHDTLAENQFYINM